ncbi:rhamnulokinase [Brachybacterium sp. DNPG3]
MSAADGAVGADADTPAAPFAVAAVDLGATSGRVMLGVVRPGSAAADGAGASIELLQARRFENGLSVREGHLSWDVEALWAEIRAGLTAAQELARAHGLPGISSIGIDSWAVDYGLVSPDGARIGEVIAYRDDRTDGVPEQVAARVDAAAQYASTGIAQQSFITLHQLAADDRLAGLPAGSTLLLVPDLIGFLLTGERRTERTNASTTGMLSATTGDWDDALLAAAGIGRELLAPLVGPGERIGRVAEDLARELGIPAVPVVAVGSHDTASAVLAVPAEERPEHGPVAYISSGTWSLIGLELERPVTTERARTAGFTNEGGADGRIRFLKNVAGMWLLSESIRQWEEEGAQVELEGLLAAAAAIPGDRFRIDPTDPAFLAPGRMADRVALAAEAVGGDQEHPRTPAELVRCILESLSETYRDELRTACRIAGVPMPTRLHVVGGGSRNALLNRLTADALGVDVIAGPVEATALGNVAVQARALGVGASPRELVRASTRASVEVFEPTAE